MSPILKMPSASSTPVIERLGGVDILVNNAGTGPYNGPVIDADLPRWNKTFEVNLTAPLVFSQLAWHKHMKNTEGGSIINISSVGGFSTHPHIGVLRHSPRQRSSI